jgi:hypothetical protein
MDLRPSETTSSRRCGAMVESPRNHDPERAEIGKAQRIEDDETRARIERIGRELGQFDIRNDSLSIVFMRLLERGAGCEPIVLRSGKRLRILCARLRQRGGLRRLVRKKLS